VAHEHSPHGLLVVICAPAKESPCNPVFGGGRAAFSKGPVIVQAGCNSGTPVADASVSRNAKAVLVIVEVANCKASISRPCGSEACDIAVSKANVSINSIAGQPANGAPEDAIRPLIFSLQRGQGG
jgi:hypothetical protein